MAKARTAYACTECGGQTSKWQGQCPHCNGLRLKPESLAVEAAVQEAVASGQGTQEIGGSLGTSETGDYIAAHVRRSQS